MQEPISPYGPFQRYEANPVPTKQPKEVINAAIVAYLRSHIQKEDGYLEFAGSKGRLLPIPDLLKGYRFATRIVNVWANKKTPPTVEGCPNKRITKVCGHVYPEIIMLQLFSFRIMSCKHSLGRRVGEAIASRHCSLLNGMDPVDHAKIHAWLK
jgi:hypothetical protein